MSLEKTTNIVSLCELDDCSSVFDLLFICAVSFESRKISKVGPAKSLLHFLCHKVRPNPYVRTLHWVIARQEIWRMIEAFVNVPAKGGCNLSNVQNQCVNRGSQSYPGICSLASNQHLCNQFTCKNWEPPHTQHACTLW